MFGLDPAELMLVVLIIMLLFGARHLPSLARGSGHGLSEFKTSLKTMEEPGQLTKSNS